ncbi:peptidase M16 [Micrococcales bacterium 31B]|nr:peptidase M16 [Micrococcales bacterium 31B]
MTTKKRPLLAALTAVTAVAGLAFGLSAAAQPAEALNQATAANTGTPGIVEVTHEAPTWDEFKASVITDGTGTYVVDGDHPIFGDEALRHWYEAAVGGATGGSLKDDHDHGGETDLIINHDMSGNPTYWNRATVGNLTYCVSNAFGSAKQDIIDALERGSHPWEDASSAIDFRYVPSQDYNCNTSNPNIVFPVLPDYTPGLSARAFFPDTPKQYRSVVVTPLAFEDSVPVENIMAHELGHTLGFRHEHIRLGLRGCTEGNNWEPLTPYDSNSVMHYPDCSGTGDMSFTSLDREGTQIVYGR